MIEENLTEEEIKGRWLRMITHPHTIQQLADAQSDIFIRSSHMSLATAVYSLFVEFALDYSLRLSHHWRCLPYKWRQHIMTVQLVCRKKGLPRPLVDFTLLDYCAIEWRRQTMEQYPLCFKHVLTTMSYFNDKQTQRFMFVGTIKVGKTTIDVTSPEATLRQLKKKFFE